MMKRALLILVLAACKDGSGGDSEREVAQRFKDKMCACKDYACAQKVSEEIARRGQGKAQPDPEVVKIYKSAMACVEKLAADRKPHETQPAVPAKVTADSLVRAARDWIGAKYPGTFIHTLRVSYVDASGAIEPTYGELHFEFGAPQTVVDDPNRRTGVPAPRDAKVITTCPGLRWLIQDRWHTWQKGCADMQPYTLQCTVRDIWKLAIAKGAPADAVAQISFSSDRDAHWLFQIVDDLRHVNITHRFLDSCEPVVEKP